VNRVVLCRLLLARLALQAQQIRVARTGLIAQAICSLQFQLSKFRLGPSYLQQFHDLLVEATRAHLRELYRELVPPIRHQLKAQRLSVVPHESLHYAPFHALYDGPQYLAYAFTVSYTPSASIYVQCCEKRANQASGSLILGVPDPRVPSIREEIQSVATAYLKPKCSSA
jgi:CHAT domain-containing protein